VIGCGTSQQTKDEDCSKHSNARIKDGRFHCDLHGREKNEDTSVQHKVDHNSGCDQEQSDPPESFEINPFFFSVLLVVFARYFSPFQHSFTIIVDNFSE
jgi:hypothetical protein